jgi:serine/threonine protein kinase
MVTLRGGDRVDTMFGPYELQSLIGVGGMGEVYRAYDTVRDRIVALKLLLPELAADTRYQERFRRESRVAARLQEPHIVPVHDWGDIDGVLYIDMRLVEGANLKSVLAECGPLDPARATSIITQLAAALDAAHADGLVHRDIKPENILLTPSDFVYLADFGIAHQGGDGGLTRTGAAIGSCTYMAPERFSGGVVGPASDVYSLACVFYECLTGWPPFAARELSQLMSAHMLAPPPRASAARPVLNAAFDDVIGRGMAKKPQARFSSAGEFAAAARGAAAGRPSAPLRTREFPAPQPPRTAPLPSQKRRRSGTWRWSLVGAALGLLTAGLGASLWTLMGSEQAAAPSVPQAAPPSTTTETLTTTAPTTKSSTTPAPPPTSASLSQGLPGTDGQGFLNNAAARCDNGDAATAMAHTTKSLLVVCQSAPNSFYYRGTRLSDGASIELANAARNANGWNVNNPADGTEYVIRPDQLTISRGQASEVEPMLQYASD